MMSLIKQSLLEEGEEEGLLSENQMTQILMNQKMQINFSKMDKKREMTIVMKKILLN